MARKRNPAALQAYVQETVMRLSQADPDIKAIALFGSCVYAPDLAQDIDLLIITAHKKDLTLYWEALDEVSVRVDVVVKEVDEHLGNGLKLGVNVFGQLVWGERKYVEEVIGEMPVPRYEDARERLFNGDQYIQDAHAAPSESRRQGHYRDAFNCLFDAARLATMTFLNTEETRWGQLRRRLSSPFAERFRQIVERLHGDYFYESRYPAEEVEEEHQKWRDKVGTFIGELEGASG